MHSSLSARFLLVGALCLGAPLLPLRADDTLPKANDASRYARMADRSPFAPPTVAQAVVPAAPPPPNPKWSDQLAVTLLTQQGSTYYASVLDKSKGEKFLLQSNREDVERHLAVASVQWGDGGGQTTVTLRHNNEFAAVRFDPGAASSPAAAVPAPMFGRPLPGGPPGGQPPRAFNNAVLSPQAAQNVVRRQVPIRTTPVIAPAIRPPNVTRPDPNADDDDE